MFTMTIERTGWYTGHMVETQRVATEADAARMLGYPDRRIFLERADGTLFADLSDDRYGGNAYMTKVTLTPIDPTAALRDALAVLMLDPEIRKHIDPQAYLQARDALALAGVDVPMFSSLDMAAWLMRRRAQEGDR